MNYLEKDVILGAVQSGPDKSGSNYWYRVHYLDLATGTAHMDYFENEEDAKKLINKKVPIGTKCVGFFTGNSRNILVLVGTK